MATIHTKRTNQQLYWIAGAVVLAVILGVIVALSGSKDKDSGHGHMDMNSSGSGEASKLVGKPAPAFTLPEADGRQVSLASYRGKTTIVFFTEGLMCYPACWNQIAALGSDPELNTDKIATVSIVNDLPGEWQQAVKKMPELGKERMLFDTDKRVSGEYSMLYLPSSMHKGQRTGHTYVIVDPNGVVRDVWDDPDMGVRNRELKQKLGTL